MSTYFEFEYLPQVLRFRNEHQPDEVAYRYLRFGQNTDIEITYRQLHKTASSIAHNLFENGLSGKKALLIYPSGIDFISAFFGCLYAGVVPIPVSVVRENRASLSIVEKIAIDSEAEAILCHSSLSEPLDKWRIGRELTSPYHFFVTDGIDVDNLLFDCQSNVEIDPQNIALIQYTSGSTNKPKGVRISHQNILHNQAALKAAARHSEETIIAGWLPHYHDMGLIFNLLQPMYLGVPCIFMSPTAFVQQPVRWLQAISDYRVTTSGGPNFAFDLCVRNVKDDQLGSLDLSSWGVAFNGAEVIRKETVDLFCEKFSSCGFSKNAMYPCYGLAESTLLVTGSEKGEPLVYREVLTDALKEHRVKIRTDESSQNFQSIIGCGHDWGDQSVLIVNPETCSIAEPDEVGEIWVKGKSVTQGYVNDEDNKKLFGTLSDDGDGPYLRTGDLGFVYDNNLFISGRIKELLIIRGQNYYPHDIENLVQQSHESLVIGGGAAFSIDRDGEERLVVVQEVKRTYLRSVDPNEIFETASWAIFDFFGIPIHTLVLIKPASLLKTSSGKIRRAATRDDFLRDELRGYVTKVTKSAQPDVIAKELGSIDVPNVPYSSSNIASWINNWLIQHLSLDASQLDLDKPFSSFGLDSVGAVSLTQALAGYIGCDLDANLAWDYPSIHLMSDYVSQLSLNSANKHIDVTQRNVISVDEPIAVIGVSCRFPGGVNNVDEFWHLLRDGNNAITEVPGDRWDIDKYFDSDPDTKGKMYSRHGGFLSHIDRFDAEFFGLPPRVVDVMDPQQRLLMEISWEAFENAGIDTSSLSESATGVFIGLCSDDYLRLQNLDTADHNTTLGNSRGIAAGRLSHFFGFRGPALQLDSTCASSLNAVHLACQSLRLGESNLAIAGGVNLMISPSSTIQLCRLNALSKQGQCRSFDAAADGYVRGEGGGIVVLKRLSDAIADGDRILAKIIGSAVNHDGFSNGLTAPNGNAQQQVIEQALLSASATADQVQYVEAHGTGTPLGDPIEIAALGRVFNQGQRQAPLLIGSVKTNIGHLEGAAGIASFIKVLMSLQKREIPPSLNINQKNPHVQWDKLPIDIATSLTPWTETGSGRKAGISAFGFSGTNVHIIIEEFLPEPVEAANQSNDYVLLLSAKTRNALSELINFYRFFIESSEEEQLTDICHSAAVSRSHFVERAVFRGASNAELMSQLNSYDGSESGGLSLVAKPFQAPPKLALSFSDIGHEYWGQVIDLYRGEPVFKDAVDDCCHKLNVPIQCVLDNVWQQDENSNGETKSESRTGSQRLQAQFVAQYALYRLLGSWGIVSDCIVSGKTGGLVSAVVSGVMSIADVGRLISIYTEHRPLHSSSGEQSRENKLREKLNDLVANMESGKPTIPWIASNESVNEACCIDPDFWLALVEASHEVDLFSKALRQQECDILLDLSESSKSSKEIYEDSQHIEYLFLHSSENLDFSLKETLIKCYLKGVNIEWKHTFLADGQKVQLPNYPFQRKKFWLNSERPNNRSDKIPADIKAGKPRNDGSDWLYKIIWQEKLVGAHYLSDENSSFIPLAKLIESTEPKRGELVDSGKVSTFQQGFQQLELVCVEYICKALESLGFRFQEGSTFNSASIGDVLGVATLQRKLLSRLLNTLRNLGMFAANGDDWCVTSEPFKKRSEIAEIDREFANPLLVAEKNMLHRCGEGLGGVLKGTIEPLDLLFSSDSSSGENENDKSVYEQSFVYSQFNQALAQLVDALLAQAPQDGRKLRILEIGAGTGSTTEFILPLLADYDVEYIFTDLSSYFLSKAEHKFGEYPFVQYSRFDVEVNPAAQGYTARYDLVIAANVLHATKDIRNTLEHVKQVTKPGGMVMLVEGNGASNWLDLTFGMTEGWWHFEDVELRENYCLLNGDQWIHQFKEVGFDDAEALKLGFESQQSIVIAQAPEVGTVSEGDNGTDKKVSNTNHWLIFVDHDDSATKLKKELDEQGQTYSFVFKDSNWRQDGNAYFIDPREPEHFNRLLDSLSTPLDHVLFHWEQSDSVRSDLVEQDVILYCALLNLVRSLSDQVGETAVEDNARLYIVTTLAQPWVLDAESSVDGLAISQSPLLGLGKVIALEQPKFWGGMIDLESNDPANYKSLVNEIRGLGFPFDNQYESQVTYRLGKRFVPRIVSKNNDLHEGGATNDTPAFNFDAERCYLITGGFGAIGFEIADYLVGQGVRHLVLLGRSGFAKGDAGVGQAASVGRWKEAGVHVELALGDVCEQGFMETLFARFGSELPELAGIFHAAGVNQIEPCHALDIGKFESVFNVKAKGALVLHQLSKKMELHCFVLMSSCASVWGAVGLGGYAAASQFLDALAFSRRSQSLSAISINWALWGGHNMVGAEMFELLQRMGLEPMDPTLAVQMIGRLLSEDKVTVRQSQQIVARMDWSTFSSVMNSTSHGRLLEQLVGEDDSKAALLQQNQPDLSVLEDLKRLPEYDRLSALEEHIENMVSNTLRLSPDASIGRSTPFMELGLDSLMMIEVKNKIVKSLGITLPSTVLFDQPNINRLSTYVLSLLNKELASGGTVDPSNAQTIVRKASGPDSEAIAIIGVGIRLPGGVKNSDDYWDLLTKGECVIAEGVENRMWKDDAGPLNVNGEPTVISAGLLDNIGDFDAGFFQISPLEARNMDPQQRVILEVSWEALEQAGYASEKLTGCSMGIFFGVGANEYGQICQRYASGQDLGHVLSGNAVNMIAGRLAYFLGTSGPSLVVDTACSSSMVAINTAVQNIRTGACEMALAGGINLLLSESGFNLLSAAQVISPTGRCLAFDQNADGIVRAEGCGVVVLKRLLDALADRDNIIAVIQGLAVNQDGTSSSLTAPNGVAQEAVIKQALDDAGVNAGNIDWVEAHGTATALGDPIEANALGAVYGRKKNSSLWISSQKSTIGHTEAASGVANLVKVALALQHECIPKQVNYTNINPQIELKLLGLDIPVEPVEWKSQITSNDRDINEKTRIAAASSFGFSGTNAHVILAEAPYKEDVSAEVTEKGLDDFHILTLSAKSENALKTLAKRYVDHLHSCTNISFEDICYTLAIGRRHFEHRMAIVATDAQNSIDQIEEYLLSEESSSAIVARIKSKKTGLSFFFSFDEGLDHKQGSFNLKCQYASSVYEKEPLYRQVFDECCSSVYGLSGLNISSSLSDPTAVSKRHYHTLRFILDYSSAVLWTFWGIKPNHVSGAGVGSIVALCLARVINLEDALKLVGAYDDSRAPVSGEPAANTHTIEKLVNEISFAEPVIDLITGLNRNESTGLQYQQFLMTQLAFDKEADFVKILPCLPGKAIYFYEGALSGIQTVIVPGREDSYKEFNKTQWLLWQCVISECYLAGITVDWHRLYAESTRQRVPLPTYPFERTHYWQGSDVRMNTHLTTDDSETLNVLASSVDSTDYMYQACWSAKALFMDKPSADYFPPITSLLDRINEEIGTERIGDVDRSSFSTALADLEFLSIEYIISAFSELGISSNPESENPAELDLSQLQILEKFRPLVHRFSEIVTNAAENNSIEGGGDISHLSAEDLLEKNTALNIKHPFIENELNLLHRCGSQLTKVLKGQLNELDVLFPKGDIDTLRRFYADPVMSRWLNEKLVKAIKGGLENHPANRGIRVLEIGGGTAATTSEILPSLPIDKTSYTFTDISAAFIEQAKLLFSDYQCFDYKLLDIEKDPSAQGFALGSYDIVVVANVLHATKSLPKTLAHINQLLSPGGMLLFIEGTEKLAYQDVTFGLTEGWWHFSDGVRNDYPLLSSERWNNLVVEQGFDSCICVDEELTQPQSLFIAKTKTAQAETLENDVVQNFDSSWLIFADESEGIATELSLLLEKKCTQTIYVRRGASYKQISDTEFVLDVDKSEDYSSLCDALLKNGTPITHLIHLWSVDSVFADSMSDLDIIQSQSLGCKSVLYIVQAMEKAKWLGRELRLCLVSKGTQVLTNEAQLKGLAQTTLSGMCNVLALEHPGLNVLHVDLGDDLSQANKTEKTQFLHDELVSVTAEQQVGLYAGKRYVRELRPLSSEVSQICRERMEALTDPTLTTQSLRSDKSYLVVGSLSGLGLEFAKWSVKHGARFLVLVGRSKPSVYAEQVLERFRQDGVQVLILQADVASFEQMSVVFDRIADAFPELAGIVHSAGILDDEIIAVQEWSDFEKVLSVKVRGSWNLHILSQNMPLDLFVVFSSMTSLIGNIGQSNHSAANAFEDALIAYRRSRGLVGQSINWGPWSEVGAAVDSNIKEKFRRYGIETLEPSMALNILGALLSPPKGEATGTVNGIDEVPYQVGVIILNWLRLSQSVNSADASVPYLIRKLVLMKEPSAGEQDDGVDQDPVLRDNESLVFIEKIKNLTATQRTETIKDYIATQSAELLGLPSKNMIRNDIPLQELGLDSLIAVRLRDKLVNGFGVSMPASLLFDYPDISSLAQFVNQSLFSELDQDQGEIESGSLSDKLIEDIQLLSEEEADQLLDELYGDVVETTE